MATVGATKLISSEVDYEYYWLYTGPQSRRPVWTREYETILDAVDEDQVQTTPSGWLLQAWTNETSRDNPAYIKHVDKFIKRGEWEVL